MGLSSVSTHRIGEVVLQPAARVVAGLGLLLVTMAAPSFPACTGMALVALGATAMTIERLGHSPARGPALLAHAFVYIAIYLLFVGATLDAAARYERGLSAIARLDLSISVLLMTSFIVSLAANIRRSLSTEY
jgi:hypothetical protein